MSPAMPAFSSSRRSMRSMKALSWSAATDSVWNAASSMNSAFDGWRRSQGYVHLVETALMRRLRSLEAPQLRCRGLALMALLPLLVGHAVDMSSALLLRECDPALVGGILQPVGEAVAAEARKVHEVDVLNVRALAQMLEEPAEGGGLQLGPGRRIDVRHGRFPQWRRSRSRVREACRRGERKLS